MSAAPPKTIPDRAHQLATMSADIAANVMLELRRSNLKHPPTQDELDKIVADINAEIDDAVTRLFAARMRLGMLLPSSNPVGEPEVAAMLPPGISVHTTRLKLAGSSAEELLAMTAKVEEGASLLADAGVDIGIAGAEANVGELIGTE